LQLVPGLERLPDGAGAAFRCDPLSLSLGRLEPGDLLAGGGQGRVGALGDLDRRGGLGLGRPPFGDAAGQLGAQGFRIMRKPLGGRKPSHGSVDGARCWNGSVWVRGFHGISFRLELG
jgi:hypothetical protein